MSQLIENRTNIKESVLKNILEYVLENNQKMGVVVVTIQFG